MTSSRFETGGATERGEPKFTVRVIHRCQFCCPSCSTFSGPGGKGRLSFRDFSEAMRVLSRADFRGIVNVSGGEPTLHPDLPRMLEFASEQLPHSRIAVFTHGHWVGSNDWEIRLSKLLAGPNVLVRFSLDRAHAIGIARSQNPHADEKTIRALEVERFEKARLFVEACRALGAKPGKHYDFAFKGTPAEAREYTKDLGEVPIYLITFRPEPAERPKTPGFFALDVDDSHQPLVYPTLGHIPRLEPLGGLECLNQALEMNRSALSDDAADEKKAQDLRIDDQPTAPDPPHGGKVASP